MNSEELRKQSQQIINEARTKTTQEDEAAADKITDKIPDLIKTAIAAKKNFIGVMHLVEVQDEKRAATPPTPPIFGRAKSILNSHDPNITDIFESFFGNRNSIEERLTGSAKIVFNRCREAGLNPYIGQDPDTKQWGIGIRW